MSSICGLCRPDGAPVDPSEIAAMLDRLAHWRADARGHWTAPGIGLGHLMLRTTPQSRGETLPLADPAHDLAITGDLRLDNRDALAEWLGIPAADLPAWPDGRLALEAYRTWGDRCTDHLLGDFAFAVWDGAARQLFCARDAFGIKPFFYAHDGRQTAFASEMKGLLALPWIDRAPDETWIGDCLHRLELDNVSTLYAGIRRLPAAHVLVADRHGLRLRRYWSPGALPDPGYARDDDYVEAFRECLVRAVRRRIDTPLQVGAELSGGLDSSGVSAIAHDALRKSGRALFTFSQVRPRGHEHVTLPRDERAAIEILVRHTGMHNQPLDGGGGILDALAWAATYYDEPPRNVVSLYNDGLYDSASAHGVGVLLSGFGGDQCVSAAGAPPDIDLLRAGRLVALWRELSAPGRQGPLRESLRLAGRAINHPAVDMLLRRRGMWRKHPYRLTRNDFARRVGMWRRAYRWNHLYAGRPLDGQPPAHPLHRPNVALRLEYAHVSTAARRIEYRYPLLDRELVSQYLATPARLRYHRGLGRYLFRRALEPWVPGDIRLASGPGASANPGVALRKRRDRDELEARVRALPPGSPVLAYVDPAKLGPRRPRGSADDETRWKRITEMLIVLLLDEKLRVPSQVSNRLPT